MIIFLLAAFGLAYIAGHSVISLPFRRWLGGSTAKLDETGRHIPAKAGALGPFGDFFCALIECPACFGFWIGFVGGFAQVVSPPSDFSVSALFPWPLVLGCVVSGSNFALSRLTRLID